MTGSDADLRVEVIRQTLGTCEYALLVTGNANDALGAIGEGRAALNALANDQARHAQDKKAAGLAFVDAMNERDDLAHKLEFLEARHAQTVEALEQIAHLCRARRIGGPHMDGSEDYGLPVIAQIASAASAALAADTEAGT